MGQLNQSEEGKLRDEEMFRDAERLSNAVIDEQGGDLHLAIRKLCFMVVQGRGNGKNSCDDLKVMDGGNHAEAIRGST